VKEAFDLEDEELQTIIDDIGDAPYTPEGLLPHQVDGACDRYPLLRAHETDDGYDPEELEDLVDKRIDNDFLERVGICIAQQIFHEARQFGCRRHPRAV
jgi:hypothetical protein